MTPPVRPGKPAKKYSQAARLHDVIRILEARYGATVDELAEECGVHRRTIYRDLNAIREAGYPLLSEPTHDGQALYRFLTGFKNIPPLTFSLSELMTLYLCRGRLAFLRETPFADDLEAVFGRIRSSLPPRSVAHLERLAGVVAPRFQGLRDYSGQRNILEQLRQALLFQNVCRIHYAPPRRDPEEYLFDPYTLIFYRDSLYLGGWAHNRQALRLFLVDRIQGVEMTDRRFEVPEEFRVDDLLGSAFGLIDERPMEIKIRFFPEVAHLIRERSWHPSQRIDEGMDGSIILSFTAGGEKEILAWVFSYLPHVQVLAPESLRKTFCQGIESALDRFRAEK